MSKDIEVVIRDAENVCELARIEQGYVPDDHVAMALVRAVNNACVQVGMEPPGEQFARTSGALADAQDHVARSQLATINTVLERMGYEWRGSSGVIDALGRLDKEAHVARALGPNFVPRLARAREVAQTARQVGEHVDAVGAPNTGPSEVAVLMRAASALLDLLWELRGIEPEPVDNGDGSTTVTLTEAVEIGTTATAPGGTS